MIVGHLDTSEDPVKIAQLPIGALIFLRHDVSTAHQTIERTYSTQQINESLRLPSSEMPYWTPGFPLSLPLEHGSRIRCLDCDPTPKFTNKPHNPVVSDTGQLLDKTGDGVVTVDTDRSTAFVGFVNENGAATSHLSVDIQNDFCAITLSALDTKPLSGSNRMLLTPMGRVENTGMIWNKRRTNADVWVTPLDGAERPLGEVQVRFWAGRFQLAQFRLRQYLIKVIC